MKHAVNWNSKVRPLPHRPMDRPMTALDYQLFKRWLPAPQPRKDA